ncbi:DUF4878 domain-containing protein [Fastidiosipila sanguinis]|uniref:Uncharacterized protein n=1 Tax=Fastidiosipila sanguinis TaxID=236753 RepID=A0A2S0KMR8_9FIRM|nr:DUF4878 domain-containing protein [Fastidiosipila sanguinis]AVM42313.1 hypothetical protein C5Q98_03305 [Fastidiosipila sanguinis]
MRFNNLLNRLGMNKIYTMLALLILTIIISLLLLLGLAFKEKKAYEILEDYLKHLQTADYNEAVKLINVDKQDNWQNEFYKFSKDSSANAQLEQKFIQNTKLELISESTVDPDNLILKVKVIHNDGPKILQSISEDMQDAKIDVTDPEVVRTGESKEDMLKYYALDNIEAYKNIKSSNEITIEMRKKNKLFKTEWLIYPNDEFHKLAYGNISSD